MHLQITPLYWACLRGHLAAAEVLLKNGADVPVKDDSNLNCLDAAVERGHE